MSNLKNKLFTPLVSCLLISWFIINPLSSQRADSLLIYYDINIYSLNAEQKNSILSFLTPKENSTEKYLRITGSADYLGNLKDNQILSDNRVQTVSTFIQESFPNANFQIRDKSFGEIAYSGIKSPEGKPIDRTVKLIWENEKPTEKLVDLARLTEGSVIRLDNLNFYGGRHVLLPKSIPVLKELEAKLKENPNVHVSIQGHVCCMGGLPQKDGLDMDTKEYKLSFNRAKNIYEYLVRNGIDSTRLEYEGFGYTMPLFSPEKSQEEKTQNRRVEIKITKSAND